MEQDRTAISSRRSCTEVEQLMSDYLDDELGAADMLRFEQHMSTCSCCATLVGELKFLRQVSSSLRESPLPAGVQQRLRARLAEEVGWSSHNRSSQLRVIK